MKSFMAALLAALGIAPLGCQSIFPSTPGLQFGWQVTIPPTVTNSAVLHPVPAAPTTAFLYEGQTQLPTVQRYYTQPPAPAYQAPILPPPPPPPVGRMQIPTGTPEAIPFMPKASCGQP